MAVMQEEYQLEAQERLVDRLERVGDSTQSLVMWLGHPIEQMTSREYRHLSDYADRAEEAVRKGDKTPYLAPLTRRT